MSNLGSTISGSYSIGSDSWVSALFGTGTNASSYQLNSIQLSLSLASGSPDDITVMLYTCTGVDPYPKTHICTLSYSSESDGVYTYTTTSSIILDDWHLYSIVVTSGTSDASSDYGWIYSDTKSYNVNDGWGGRQSFLFFQWNLLDK
jgi:hypothetical protein